MTQLHLFQKSRDTRDNSLTCSFEKQALAHPERIAVRMGGDSFSYSELNEKANQLAAHLRELGVRADARVGIHLDRSCDLIVAIFAVLKAGGAYLPLDLACPEDRLRFQLEDAGADIVLTQENLSARFKGYPGRILCLGKIAGLLVSYSTQNVESTAEPDDLAYVIYTSGSTGRPKGVLVTHRNVLRLFSVTEPLFAFGAEDVWTLFHSSAFDFSVWEIFGALLYGGRLVIVPYAVSRSAMDFHQLLRDERVTVLNQTPSAFRQLIRADERAGQRLDALRYVIFGGEALEFQSLRPWFDQYSETQPQLVNMYGITETTVHVTYHAVTRGDLENGGSTIGKPLSDLIVYIADEKRNCVAPGEIGEMLVGGEGVARGYLNRPELTRERFIPNLFRNEDAPVLYCSGDLARERPDGTLEYLGRIDDQVKIRGFRIELHEIESVLARHADVQECAVLARSDEDGDPRLVAYLVARKGAEPKIEPLRAYLAESVPDYMVPAAFVFLPDFPLTANGKLDRAALPAPTAERVNLAASYTAPANELEQVLTDLWKATLRRETVGTQDNFFDVGGDSLLLTALHRDLETRMQREIPITDLFQYPTICRLAEHLGAEAPSSMTQNKIQERAQRHRAVVVRGRRP